MKKITYTYNTYIEKAENKVDKETTISIQRLLELADSYGLACIENKESLTVVGEKQFLIFNKVEVTKCQLIEIY